MRLRGARVIRTSGWVVIAVVVSQAALAQGHRSEANGEQALQRGLETRYAQCMQAARRGDIEAYWRLRTEASRRRPPELDATRIRLLADLLPPLEALQFVRLDASGKTARMLYRWRNDDIAQYSVIVYRMERGEWKLDDVSVRRSLARQPGAKATASGPPAVRRAPEAINGAPGGTLDAETRALLRAWESGKPDPSRALGAPRL
jgi:hypothetical protein